MSPAAGGRRYPFGGRRLPRAPVAIGAALVLVALAVWVAAVVPSRIPGWRQSRGPESAAYPSSATCATCHPVEAEEWRTSAHAYAGQDILVHASVCGPCHAPVGTQLDAEYLFKVTSGGELGALPAAANEGVTCITCHARSHAPEQHVLTFEPVWPNWRTTDLALRIDALDTALGPFGNGTADDPAPVANASHASAADASFQSAEKCRACHQVTFDKGPLAEQAGGPQPLVPMLTTYDEWVASSYPAAGRTCQSCHMPRLAEPGPAAVAPSGVTYDRPLPARAHADHSTAGVETAYWDPTAPLDLQARRSAEHLAGAAAVTLDVPRTVAPATSVTLTVAVRNVGAGHDLMTGFGFWREAWLEVVVTDATGSVLLSSGRLDDQGWLLDEYNPRVRQDPSLYDPYLVQLRTRLVKSPQNLTAWLQPDRTVAVPASAIKRNYNGTPVLSWAEFDADPIVARLQGDPGGVPAEPSPLEEVYTLRYAEALIRNGIPAGATKEARYPLEVDANAKGPLWVSARVLLRAMGRDMTQQQEEIRDHPPIGPVYELGRALATVAVQPK
jgi:hypothetical protein